MTQVPLDLTKLGPFSEEKGSSIKALEYVFGLDFSEDVEKSIRRSIYLYLESPNVRFWVAQIKRRLPDATISEITMMNPGGEGGG